MSESFVGRPCVGFIGGNGPMGRLFQPLMTKYAESVCVSSRSPGSMSAVEVVRQCQVVILAVPMGALAAVLQSIAPYLTPQHLLMDLTSLKDGPCQQMLTASDSAVIGLHPLFGPHMDSLHGTTMVACPVRPGRWLPWVRSWVEQEGIRLVCTDPPTHDRWMAVTQCWNHFSLLLFGDTARRAQPSTDSADAFSTVLFAKHLAPLHRMQQQPADMYATMQFQNPYFTEVLEHAKVSWTTLENAIKQHDYDAFRGVFDATSATWTHQGS